MAKSTKTWVGGFRFSLSFFLIIGVAAVALWVVVPTMLAYFAQRQYIVGLQIAISQQESEVNLLKAQRARWQDGSFVIAQARERLYYVQPGEVSYLVIDDRVNRTDDPEVLQVSKQPVETKSNWVVALFDSAIVSGLAEVAPAAATSVPGNSAPATPAPVTPAPVITKGGQQ